ncbi:MAG: hypothetical protein JJE18_04415 [Eubacteriaceae bacterium]|nr:hypothetical protein [Eubacteriaceae bacterium]
MKKPCEKCEKTIGFFERSFKIENEKLNIKYESLCNDCHGIIKNGIGKVDEMYQWMMANLNKNKDVQKNGMSSIDVDLLILLAVEALFSVEPNFYEAKTNLNQTIIKGADDRSIDKQKDIVRIVYKILLYGFEANLTKLGLRTNRNFMAYMIQNEIYLEEVEINCGEEDELVKANVFISHRGLIIETIESPKLIYIPIPRETIVDYQVEASEIINEISFKNAYYHSNNKKSVVITLISEKIMFSIAYALDRFNQKTLKLQDKRKKDSLEYFNDRVLEDIQKLKPGEFIEAIHLDCLLLCIVKNLKSEKMFTLEALFDPKGTTIELLWAYYRQNLRNMGIDNDEKIVTYLLKNCLYTEGFSIKHGNKPSDKGWGFFTTKGYIIYFKRSQQVFFVYTETFPNGLYHPCNRVAYDHKQYLQLIMNNGRNQEGDYRDLDELIFYSEKPETIIQMERFFERHNLYYQMESFLKRQKEIQGKREKYLEVRRIVNHIFSDLGYLPYCIYDEWYAIQTELQKSDLLLSKVIETGGGLRKNYTLGKINYAPKIIEAFNQGAIDIQESLDINEESVAKAILWVGWKEAVTETLSEEWVRIAGNIVADGDNALSAFFRYVNLKTIEPDKVYYMGLFIYHLMERGILPSDNFLDNYEGAVRIFLECRRVVEEPKYDGSILPMDELLEEVFPGN